MTSGFPPEQTIYVNTRAQRLRRDVCAIDKACGSFLVGREPVKDFSWEMCAKTILGGRKGGVPK
jgi:hypothetical protein